jgi:hypothetical protein
MIDVGCGAPRLSVGKNNNYVLVLVVKDLPTHEKMVEYIQIGETRDMHVTDNLWSPGATAP